MCVQRARVSRTPRMRVLVGKDVRPARKDVRAASGRASSVRVLVSEGACSWATVGGRGVHQVGEQPMHAHVCMGVRWCACIDTRSLGGTVFLMLRACCCVYRRPTCVPLCCLRASPQTDGRTDTKSGGSEQHEEPLLSNRLTQSSPNTQGVMWRGYPYQSWERPQQARRPILSILH